MSSYALLFPGQGSQYVGMTEKLSGQPAADSIFRTAERILGYDLKSMCLSGPQSRLDETVHCQPAVMAASLAAVESLRVNSPEVGGAWIIIFKFPALFQIRARRLFKFVTPDGDPLRGHGGVQCGRNYCSHICRVTQPGGRYGNDTVM